jgi:manganese-dependent inorganic pyrophosphatase
MMIFFEKIPYLNVLKVILSYRSPTTTDEDRNSVSYLQTIAQIIDMESYVDELFQAKSDLTGLTMEQILLLDYKRYVFKDQTWAVGVAETWHSASLLEHTNELLQEMIKEKNKTNLDGILFSIIDILQEKNIMLIPGEPENTVVSATFNVNVTNQMVDLGSRISRKLQIIPPLEDYFNKNS